VELRGICKYIVLIQYLVVFFMKPNIYIFFITKQSFLIYQSWKIRAEERQVSVEHCYNFLTSTISYRLQNVFKKQKEWMGCVSKLWWYMLISCSVMNDGSYFGRLVGWHSEEFNSLHLLYFWTARFFKILKIQLTTIWYHYFRIETR
jgi:hypothetical protein